MTDADTAWIAEDDQLAAMLRDIVELARHGLAANILGLDWKPIAQQLSDAVFSLDEDTAKLLLCRASTAAASGQLARVLT